MSSNSRGLQRGELLQPREQVLPVDVTLSHYSNPQPPAYKAFIVGSGNQAIREALDVDESRQPMGEHGKRRGGLDLSPPGRWLVHIAQPTTCTEQPLSRAAYLNQANAQASIYPST